LGPFAKYSSPCPTGLLLIWVADATLGKMPIPINEQVEKQRMKEPDF
jgi:hypothetical protein